MLLLMAAAPDTTSPLISALVTSILADPSTLQKVQSELSAAISTATLRPGHPVPWSTISQLPYFMACIHEASRLFPSIPAILPRRVGSGGLVLPDGRLIPEGTAVGVAAGVINRDKSIFGGDADVWNPERWLVGGERFNRMNHFVFTWGWGSRKCPGKHIALLECCKLVLQVSHRCCSFARWSSCCHILTTSAERILTSMN